MKTQFTFLFFLFSLTTVFCQATLSGSVTDGITGEAMFFADIIVYQDGNLVAGTYTDLVGDYSLKLKDGNYDIVFSHVGYEKSRIEKIQLTAGKETYLDGMLISGVTLEEAVVVSFKMSCFNYCSCCGGSTIMMSNEEENKIPVELTEETSNSLVYPNPTSSHFNIQSEKEIKDASIFNLSGQLVKTLNKGQTNVDVSDLLAGTYFLVITEGTIVQTEKIVVVRD